MLRVAPWAHPWDALCLLAVWPWADVEGICPFWPRIGLSDPLRPQHPHPEGAADVWHVCYLQAEADAPSDTTTHCSQRETSRPPTWRVSSSGGVIKSVKHINLRPQKGQDYHVAFNPRGLLRCDKNERGIKKANCRRGRRREEKNGEKWWNNASDKGVSKVEALKWSHTFCMITAVKFLILSQQAQKTTAAWD